MKMQEKTAEGVVYSTYKKTVNSLTALAVLMGRMPASV